MAQRPPADIRERFGDTVRLRREVRNLTQEDLAEAAQIHRTYLSDVERGNAEPIPDQRRTTGDHLAVEVVGTIRTS